ncbi:ROK family protein [Roseibium denhamense]|uniref:Glucokinase n=1 Tax=Roseibium denhamense TaxID=76305 RepID=A0ABY1P2Z4_9HYPH|nr:ROK family protein [Roseibium denhamense]MTI05115.1 ROK family protein [Roseibium denhamense]SMP22804.1 glucokinase [Roseibium denhamense]
MSMLKTHQKFSYPVLVADIGGTNARFALVDSPSSPTRMCGKTATADHSGISDAIRSVLHSGSGTKPRTAIIAVAGPVSGDVIPLTNAAWVIEPLKMISGLQLEQVIVLNDFEAQALALPGYQGSDIEQIGQGTARPDSTKFVLGPGTGLGAAAMIRAASTWVPVPGEGGHVELGPVTAEDYEIWPHIEFYGGRLGAEQLLSGTGLPRLAHGVANWMQRDSQLDTPASVTMAAEDNDPVAVKTLEVFARSLGRVAGDFALTVFARGGVYLTGGVTPRIDPFLTDGNFRKAFEAKAPHNALMAKIPTFIVRHPDPALEGLASFARAPEEFAVELAGRQWSGAAAALSG